MPRSTTRAHPFMPNSTPEARAALLEEIGARSVEELFGQIPEAHRLREPMGLPPSLSSEPQLRRHLHEMMSQNLSCEDALSFLGGGCWRHHVPAVCDEVVRRAEFLTPVWGTPSSDFGRNQAWFEFQSQMGELVAFDMVAMPVYSWGCAAGHAIRMASRMNGRRKVVLPRYVSPERRAVIASYCETDDMPSFIEMVEIGIDDEGRLDIDSARAAIDETVAAVYLETPSFLGRIETAAKELGELAHAAGAEFIVGVDPISLGVLEAPSVYGADIAVGSIQPLGVHMNGGGGLGGFIASRDDERYARQYPTLQVGVAKDPNGAFGFGLALAHQSSYGMREEGNDWTGNSTYLWAIAASVYMAVMGPRGFEELGETILQRAHFAARLLDGIDGVNVRWPGGFFKEFVVDFSASGKSVAGVNEALLGEGILGGIDLSRDFPELGASALYCVTELHTEDDLKRLADALAKAVAQ